MVALGEPLLASALDATPVSGASPSKTWTNVRQQEIEDCRAKKEHVSAGHGGAGQIAVQILAGVLLWLVTLSLSVGFATFAFLQMPERTPLAISMQILGSAVVYLWLGMNSTNPASCVQASPIPSIYISVFIQAAQSMHLTETSEISTVLLFVWLTTFSQGIAFVICSRYSMGDVLQYFPPSVIMGYNGGIGLLILNASVAMLSGVNPLENSDSFLQVQPMLLTLPGVLVALVCYMLSQHRTLAASPTFKVAPIMSVILVFYIVLLLSGLSLEEARRLGWVFPDSGWMSPADPVTTFQLSAVNWDLLNRHALPLLPPMTLISMIAQYASLGAILLQTADSTKDADDETRHLGCASVISGILCAMPNLSGMAPSSLLLGVVGKKGARGSCLVVCGILHLSVFISGFPLVAYIPKCSIAGCLLMPIAFKMIRGALFESLAVSTWSDYLIIWVMSWTTLLANIQYGLLSGFTLTVFRLLYEYAHFDIVSRRESIKDVCTVKERSRQVRHILTRFGQEVMSYRLKGVLFFANCVSFKLELQQLLDDTESCPPKIIVVDFTEVVYVDSSVWEIFANFSAQAKDLAETEVVLCALSASVLQDLSRQGERLRSRLKVDHLRHAYLHTLEQLEDKLLCMVSSHECNAPQAADADWADLAAFVARGFPQEKADLVDDGALENKLQQYFKKVSYEGGQMVQHQDCIVNSFYFICSGEFHVFVRKAPSASRLASPMLARSPYLGRSSGTASKFDIPSRKMSKDRFDANEIAKAFLLRKLFSHFVEGVEMFCHEDKKQMMEAYTCVQCRAAGDVLQLSREGFEAMRARDPQLSVALLLAATSRREVLRRRLVQSSFEPEEVEVVGGCRRKFTMPLEPSYLSLQSEKNRFNPAQVVGSMLQRVRTAADNRRSTEHLGSTANILDFSGRAIH
jgi:MFS superfamily sulfate permease-like transporter/CRP-like cAMP-binding protein